MMKTNQREISETVELGDNQVTVSASWYDQAEGDPLLHVAVSSETRNGRTLHLANIGSEGLKDLAQAILTVDRAIYAEPVPLPEESDS